MPWILRIRWTEEHSEVSIPAIEPRSKRLAMSPKEQLERAPEFNRLPPVMQAVLKVRAEQDPSSITFESLTVPQLTYYFSDKDL